MGFLDYYRQFEELAPDEVSRRLRERRDAERSKRLAVACLEVLSEMIGEL